MPACYSSPDRSSQISPAGDKYIFYLILVSYAFRRRYYPVHSPMLMSVWSRLLEEEATKRSELEQIHLRQQRAISETEAEKQELEKERLAKESALQAAMTQLEQLEQERQGALEQYQVRGREQSGPQES